MFSRAVQNWAALFFYKSSVLFEVESIRKFKNILIISALACIIHAFRLGIQGV